MLKKLMIGTALGALALSGAYAQSTNPASPNAPAGPQATQGNAPSSPSMDSKSSSSTGGSSMSSSSSPPSSSASSSSSPSPSTTGQASSPSSPTPSASATMSGSSDKKFVSSQSSEQFLASKFTGTDVVGADDKKIGDVNDVLFDKQGKIMAYVVGVGGFLGIGSKNVALEPSAFQVVKGEHNSADKLKLSMTKDQLEKAPNFEPYKDPARTTTGSGSPASSPSAMGGSRPATSPAPSK